MHRSTALVCGSSTHQNRILGKAMLFIGIGRIRAFAFYPSSQYGPSGFQQRGIGIPNRCSNIKLAFHARNTRYPNPNICNNMSTDSESQFNNYKLAQDPSELFDLYPAPPSPSLFNSIIDQSWGDMYFPHPVPNGESKERSKVHTDGDWHRSVQVWIVQAEKSKDRGDSSKKVRVLLQRRSPFKDTHPNQLDVSCAGHVNSGDDILQTTMREMEEELGGNGLFNGRYSSEDLQQNRAFTVASSIEGETEKFGKFICREYQDVFILWWDQNIPLETSLFSPMAEEEVAGFEIFDGNDLIRQMRDGNAELVPRSVDYVNALAKALGCE